jgi:hypothetical protein
MMLIGGFVNTKASQRREARALTGSHFVVNMRPAAFRKRKLFGKGFGAKHTYVVQVHHGHHLGAGCMSAGRLGSETVT